MFFIFVIYYYYCVYVCVQMCMHVQGCAVCVCVLHAHSAIAGMHSSEENPQTLLLSVTVRSGD